MRSCELTVPSARAKAPFYKEVRFTRLKPGVPPVIRPSVVNRLGMTPSKVEPEPLSLHREHENQNKRSLDSAAKAAPLGMTPSKVESKRLPSPVKNQNQNKRSLDSAAKAAPLGRTPSRTDERVTNRASAKSGQ